MQVIHTQNELNAGLRLMTAILTQMPRGEKRSKAMEVVSNLEHMVRGVTLTLKDPNTSLEGIVENAVKELNKSCAHNFDGTEVFFRISEQGDLEMVTLCDEQIMVKSMDYLTSEVGSLAGLAIMAYGMLRTFGESLMRVAKGLNSIISSGK